MGRAKDIRLKVIPASLATPFMVKHHYSRKVVQSSSLHFGAFLDDTLHGVLSFGSPLDKRKVLPLVTHTEGGAVCAWNDMLELNRMAFDEVLPRNSESRCISQAIRLIKKHAPHIKWVLSFSDATQCGDGTIYRASGFLLTGITPNQNTCRLGDGTVIHKMTLESSPTSKRQELGGRSYYDLTGGKYDFKAYVNAVKGEILKGYQLRYILLVSSKVQLSVPSIPFSTISEMGIGMYKGKPVS